MTLRRRLLAGGALLVLVPLLALALALRRDVAGRLRAQHDERVDALVGAVEASLDRRDVELGARLAALAAAAAADDLLRTALRDASDETARLHLLDWSGRSMRLAGLDALQLHDADGRILSCGHYRNDFGRVDAAMPAFLAAHGVSLVGLRRPEETFVALARADSLVLGGRRLALVAGLELDRAALAALSPGAGLAVSLLHPGGAVSPDPALEARLEDAGLDGARSLVASGDYVVRTRALPAPGGEARLVVTHSRAGARALERGLDRRLALAWAVAALGTGALALVLSARVARPVERLAAAARDLDVDRLDAEFPPGGDDEIGELAGILRRMLRRLRAGVARLRVAERRAALGDLARQVNHDLRNAVTPLRNVVRHLAQVARDEPDALAGVFRERESTLEAGLAYLDELAGRWRRVGTPGERRPVDVGAVARAVAAGRLPEDGGPVRLALEPAPPVRADPAGLRRVLENLVANACESLESGGGRVDVRVAPRGARNGPGVEIVVEDDGAGIPEDARGRVFEHFFTTKPGGSGLGLSIARRLVTDWEGSIRIEPREPRGTRVVVTLPASPDAGPGAPA